MTAIRKLFGLLLILASLAVAGWGVSLCAQALEAEPYIEDGEDGPSATLEHFLACLERKDWDGAYGDLYNYASLGLETPPEDELSRMYYDAQMDAWQFSTVGGSEMNGMRMDYRVTVRCLDLDAIAADVGKRVQSLLEEKVNTARLRSEVYNDDGTYKEELAYDALYQATREMLSDTDPYAYTQECSLSLHFADGRWLVEVNPAFISALTSGAVRG